MKRILVVSVLAVSLFTVVASYAEPTLRSAKVTFIPTKDDKDTDTKVTMTVTTKFNQAFDFTLASRNDFAGNDTWEDKSGKEYTYDLNVTDGIKLSQISGDIKTAICINPVGNDTVKFNYRLLILFQDGAPDAKPVELRQEKSGHHC